uniref:Uncharacterized protein n=1 Tax=Chlorobium chlorochromatii (strain CaD3) TaxID=340177 RepID=Q3ARE3_CHLCH
MVKKRGEKFTIKIVYRNFDGEKAAFYSGNAMRQRNKKHPYLEHLLKSAHPITLAANSKVLILSDLHMGNGGRRDEFKRNADLVRTMLESYYLTGGYSLVLNGDVEELFKFKLQHIMQEWDSLYDLFLRFQRNGFFWKTYGNHDAALVDEKEYKLASAMVHSLKFYYGNETMLLFHGHQASELLWETYPLISSTAVFVIKYIAKPMGIRNKTSAYNSPRRFALEKSIYDFSNQAKILSIIGHTHRPLFESLSKVDFLNFRIEELCRSFPAADDERRTEIRQNISTLKNELDACYQQGKKIGLRSGRYNNITIPSVFNSGCVIGKRGITALEIEGNKIRLVYWFNGKQSRKFKSDRNNRPIELSTTGYYRVVLNEDSLDYVFSRIHLLA